MFSKGKRGRKKKKEEAKKKKWLRMKGG